MIGKSSVQQTRIFIVALMCAVLSSCATTQRSSTSSADEVTTPPSATSASKAGTPPVSSASPAPTASISRPAAKVDDSSPMEFPKTSNQDEVKAVPEKMPDQTSQMKQKLAEQDAEINRIRQGQEAQAAQIDKEAAQDQINREAAEEQLNKQAVQEASPVNQAEATPAPTSSGAPRKQEDAVVFPERKDTVPSVRESPSSIPIPIERSVYFDYNEAVVLENYDGLLLANAAYLRVHPDLRVEVQGNCDERGSSEYNLALGARRAETVKRALELGGADGTRIHTVSFGKEKPIAAGHEEESWSKNRRADILY